MQIGRSKYTDKWIYINVTYRFLYNDNHHVDFEHYYIFIDGFITVGFL